MSLKPPGSFAHSSPGAIDPLTYELMAEKADALGRAGKKVETALAALKDIDGSADPEHREALIRQAADMVWAFFIQREICGFRNQADAVRRYDIPREVMIRLGSVGSQTQRQRSAQNLGGN